MYDIYEAPVDCPAAGCTIKAVECFDICLVAEGISPENEGPIWMEWTSEKAEICMKCPKHID